MSHYPATATEVANEFIGLGLNEPDVPPVDQLKLQKLLFYAYGWFLAHTDQSLFEEDFEAWEHGPVVRDIYQMTARYKRAKITQRLTTFGYDSLNDKADFMTPLGVNENLKHFVKSIWNVHKHLTGIQLCNSTHAPGEAWTIIYEKYGEDLRSKPHIPIDLIQNVFKKKLAKMNERKRASHG